MPANRDKKTGKWNAQFYYTGWTGKKGKKMKRGFETKKEAQDWERHFKLEKASSLDMTFGDFYRQKSAFNCCHSCCGFSSRCRSSNISWSRFVCNRKR